MPSQSPDALQRKLVWLTLFRIGSVTVLLGGAAVVGWRSEADLQHARPLFGVIGGTYVASIAFALLLRARRAISPLAWAQIVLDVALAASVVVLTGGLESIFLFMYVLGIVNAAILLYRRGALVALGLSLAVHLTTTLDSSAAGGVRSPVWLHATAFALTAALASYLAEQLRRTGERLEESESDLEAITALHEAIVQSMTSGLLTLDAGDRVTFLNRAGAHLTGLALGEVRGTNVARWFDVFRSDVARGEGDFTTRGGKVLRLGYSSFPLRGSRGDVLGTAVIFQDLTELRAMEERVARSERLADLGGVAAGLAHEIRNPLASLTGALDLLRHQPDLRDEDQRLMEIALREAARLEQLLGHFLEFARPAPPRRVPCDLAPVVAETLDVLMHDRSGSKLTIERALAAAPAECDPGQVKQIVWNLVRNAAEATGEGPGRVLVSTGKDGGTAWLAVEDDGPGIPAEDRSRVFLPFFTTKPEGTGLGLATVHRIVDAHGGTILVEAGSRGGARFVVHLPRAGAVDVARAAAR